MAAPPQSLNSSPFCSLFHALDYSITAGVWALAAFQPSLQSRKQTSATHADSSSREAGTAQADTVQRQPVAWVGGAGPGIGDTCPSPSDGDKIYSSGPRFSK